MRWLPQTLAGQFMAVIIVSVFVSQVLVFVMLIIKTDDKLEQYEQLIVYDQIVTIYNYGQSLSVFERERFFEAASNPEIAYYRTTQPRGKPVDASGTYGRVLHKSGTTVLIFGRELELRDVLEFWFGDLDQNCFVTTGTQLAETNCPYWELSLQFSEGDWMVATGLPSPDTHFLLAPLFVSVLLSLIGITIVVALLTRGLTAPLRQLSQTAEQMGRGEELPPLPVSGPRELSSVMLAFNGMQERITRFIHDRTTMLAAISHDLRTPITSLRLRTEFVEDETLRAHMIETLNDMQTMTDSFLTFARQDNSQEPLQDFDLVQLCQRMAQETSGMQVTAAAQSCPFRGRKVGIGRALANLVDNAIKYGGAAHVYVDHSDHHIVIRVEDPGTGVPEAMLNHIFSPFTRLDQARSVVEGSVGLGLSISRSIIRKHGGDIRPKNVPGGFRMQVTLPK